MKTEGQILKHYIDLSSMKIDEVLEKTGISRGQLYILFKEELIKDEYKARIQKLNLNIDWSGKSTNILQQSTESTGPGKQEWDRVLALFERWTTMIEKDNSVLTAIIQTGLDQGAIKFDGNVKQIVTKKHP